jgi:hypothetical protein
MNKASNTKDLRVNAVALAILKPHERQGWNNDKQERRPGRSARLTK